MGERAFYTEGKLMASNSNFGGVRLIIIPDDDEYAIKGGNAPELLAQLGLENVLVTHDGTTMYVRESLWEKMKPHFVAPPSPVPENV